jgi:hypothetical protein
MVNDPELNGKYLGTFTPDFAAVSDTLKEASYQIRKRGISQYPIFPIAKVMQPVGQMLLNTLESGLRWNFYVSFLEEFLQRNLIEDEVVFKHFFKDPDEFCCLFVIDEAFTNLVFIPFPED